MPVRPTVALIVASAAFVLTGCGSNPEPEIEVPVSSGTTPSEVRLEVLPHEAPTDDGPLSLMKSAEIVKCWEDGSDLNVQVFIEVPVESVRVVVDFLKQGKFMESKSADMADSAETFTLADAAGEFDSCQLSAAVEAG